MSPFHRTCPLSRFLQPPSMEEMPFLIEDLSWFHPHPKPKRWGGGGGGGFLKTKKKKNKKKTNTDPNSPPPNNPPQNKTKNWGGSGGGGGGGVCFWGGGGVGGGGGSTTPKRSLSFQVPLSAFLEKTPLPWTFRVPSSPSCCQCKSLPREMRVSFFRPRRVLKNLLSIPSTVVSLPPLFCLRVLRKWRSDSRPAYEKAFTREFLFPLPLSNLL